MDLSKEKESKLSTRDRYDILTFAIEAADDNGFVNSFIFERAIYCYAAIILTEDDLKEDIRSKVVENLVDAWDYLIQNNIIQELMEEYSEELNQLADEGMIWFNEYDKYATSARGILSLVEQFTGSAVTSAASALKNSAEEAGITDILQIADDWGMSRSIGKPTRENRDWEQEEQEALF